MAITPQHFACVTKYVVHFVAQSLLFATVMRDLGHFPRYCHIWLRVQLVLGLNAQVWL